MMYGHGYPGGWQGGYYGPAGAVPDMLNQYKASYQQPQMQAQQVQQSGGGMVWVQGEAGAKSFLVAPGQSVMLMDSEAMRFYIKSADASGMPLPLRVFTYTEETAQHPQTPQTPAQPALDPNKYVTRDELEARLARLTAPTEATETKEETGNE